MYMPEWKIFYFKIEKNKSGNLWTNIIIVDISETIFVRLSLNVWMQVFTFILFVFEGALHWSGHVEWKSYSVLI